MSYKVEELLALRDSVSESAVSLDRFADEEVIKEHVLRPSASATLAAAASNKSLRSSATPAITAAAPNNKPSPSPSIKRGKAERLLKEHGSPPGMRVTAGGRVVPSDLPPLANNRFAHNTFKPPPLRGLAIGSTMAPLPSHPEANNVPRLEVVGSQPVLYVGDRAYALPALEAPSSAMPPPASGIMDTSAKAAPPPPVLSNKSSFTTAPVHQPRTNVQTPFVGLDLSTLKAQQTLKRQELRTVEQTEVLQANHQTDAWRAGIIEKKRNLIIELDALRKQINAIEAAENNAPTTQASSIAGSANNAVGSVPPPTFVPQFQQSLPSAMYGYPGDASFTPMMMFQPPFGTFPTMPTSEPASFVPAALVLPAHSPGSPSRRSHAIEIKPPREEAKKQVSSALDPKSPTYEPVTKNSVAKGTAPPTLSPGKGAGWNNNDIAQSENTEHGVLSQKPSLSSIDTTDFFPTNTHEHSTTRLAPKGPEPKQTQREPLVIPSTPEKDWPASPWNEGNSSRSSNKAVAKLTSWPEAFGKQSSFSSLKQADHSQERPSLVAAEPSKSTGSINTAARTSVDQRTGTDENWSMLQMKPVNHAPSTYQEGYQAGYDHVGMPDSPDVLKGYIQGLLQFMADESQRTRNSSLRGLVASSTPHDSAISMSFNRSRGTAGGQENVRSANSGNVFDPRLDTRHSQQDAQPLTYALCNEAAHDQRTRNASMGIFMGAAEIPDNSSFAHQQMLSVTENSVAKKNQKQGNLAHIGAGVPNTCFPREFSGSHINSRGYGNPLSAGFFPSPKGYASKGFGDGSVPARPAANQRMSGLDGAMDELAELETNTRNEQQHHTVTRGQRFADVRSSSSAGADASCFGPSSSKGKQKAATSPTTITSGERCDVGAPSPATTPGSPRKTGEHSPAKAKLEQVTNKFRRSAKKDEPRNMSPEEKKARPQRWRQRLQALKDRETREMHEYAPSNARDR